MQVHLDEQLAKGRSLPGTGTVTCTRCICPAGFQKVFLPHPAPRTLIPAFNTLSASLSKAFIHTSFPAMMRSDDTERQ
ncbi:hypothetical protein SKAU_G00010710 [Synaphobranchus kaupii]|uniref:Uncharacterized protein n=1 Tax=Synaphobranchus kaupii TaxID=118154 RepID=A0A9Q1JC54_SYNKA|nr:hypothetical protein SKAU_G00010710 [Synaphobranchus kaupii]